MLTPDRFAEASVSDLLQAAGEGKVGLDQRWLRAILDRADSAIPDLVRYGTEPHEAAVIDLDGELILIFRQLKTPESIPFFVEYLRKAEEDTPEGLVEALYALREHALEPLIRLYGEMDESSSGEVAFILAAFRIFDDRVLQILLDRLEYDAGDGALDLGLYGDPAARPALEKMLGEVDDEHLKQDIRDSIEQLGRPVTDPDEPFDIFEYFPERALPETSVLEPEDLLDMLDSTDSDYRFAAAAGLINRDLPEDVVLKLLAKAQTDENEAVRAKCWEALAGEVADNDEVVTAMLSRLKDESAPLMERAGALVGLGQRANEQPIRGYAEQFYENPQTRAAALSAMWNSLDRTFSRYFPPHLEDSDPSVVRQAISGAGYLGIESAARKLQDYFANEEYRPNALFAYALAARSEVSAKRMRALLSRIEELAGGLTEEETELVQIALDERLLLHGQKPVFRSEDDEDDDPGHHHHGHHHHHHGENEPRPATVVSGPKPGRNDPCPCGSGKKYKKCHGA